MPSSFRERVARSIFSLAILVPLFFVPACADDPPVDYAGDIQRILAEHCLACHGPDDRKGGLQLHQAELAYAPLRSGNRAVVPGDADVSALIQRITAPDSDQRMPPDKDPLPESQIELLRRWIQQGANYTEHWAYRPLTTPAIPTVQRRDWIRNPVDSFILARLEHERVSPSVEADRPLLIRRLHYDLVGLPPSTDAVDRFLQDPSPNAYEDLVDRLLASPHFGERWGRHWLDKARFADSDGYEKDNTRPDAHLYRDWVIQTFNQDLPFDVFTVQQIAGDLLPDADDQSRLATAFHRQTLTNREGGVDAEQFRVAAVVDRVNTTGAVWLGLTVGCAQCHTHKYDTLTQTEYFGLYAFFNNAEETTFPWPHDTPDKQSLPARILTEREDYRPTHRLVRGDFLQPAEEVLPHVPTSLHPLPRLDPQTPPNRLDLAHWLIHEDNPITPRVAANDIWRTLFGRGLVATVDDFGVRGEPPSHPELLDWLATEYRRVGWSRKAMIRMLVTSATYRQSSVFRSEWADRDPLNTWFARQNTFRVEAEIVRDLSLAVGDLLMHRLGGPSVFPPMPPEIAALSYANNFKWNPSPEEDRYRRGLYTFFKRTAPHPNLTVFDCPDANTTLLQRQVSNTPIQALTTLNNATFVEAARGLTRRVFMELPEGSDRERLSRVLRWAVARTPSRLETARLEQLLHQSRDYYGAHGEEARQLAGSFLWPTGTDFQETASWIATVRVVLNLDEFLTRP